MTGIYLLASRTERMLLRCETSGGIEKRAIICQAIRCIVSHVVLMEVAFPVQQVLGECIRVPEDLVLRKLRRKTAFGKGSSFWSWNGSTYP